MKAVRLEPSRESYKPPADGHLTPKQVESYLAVLGRLRALETKRAGKPPIPPSDAIDGTLPDVQAASDLFSNGEEYLWVKERILEADASLMTAKLNTDVLAMLDRTLKDLRTRREQAADEGSRKLIGEQIAAFEAEAARTRREANEVEPESIRGNVKMLEPYRARLNALQGEIDRMTAVAAAASRIPAPPNRTPKAP